MLDKCITVRLFKSIVLIAILTIALLFNSSNLHADSTLPIATVYKSPTCGCCGKWISHLEANGFKVTAKNSDNLSAIKQQLGIQPQYQSCHTAQIGNYIVEGHVPAADIKRMLAEQPDIDGLAVPGMPMGSPGMEGAKKDNYDVLAIKQGSNPKVFNSY
jgi:hypothetical protein